MTDRERATKLLIKLADGGAEFSIGVSLELAGMLCHIAGGDGRGTYHVKAQPDRRPAPSPQRMMSNPSRPGPNLQVRTKPLVFGLGCGIVLLLWSLWRRP